MECYLRSGPESRGYRKRMHDIWRSKDIFEVTGQRLMDQIRQIKKNKWLSNLEIEKIKRRIEEEPIFRLVGPLAPRVIIIIIYIYIYFFNNNNNKYRVKTKGLPVVTEELKQRVTAVGEKIKRYESRREQCRQNRLFQSNQKRLFDMIDGIERGDDILPDAVESMQFWNGIWDNPVSCNEGAELTS